MASLSDDSATQPRLARLQNQLQAHPTLAFWCTFIILNLLLFLPLLILDQETLHAAYSDILAAGGPTFDQAVRGLLQRDSPDPFRLNFELLLLVTLWATVRRLRRPAFRFVMVAIYFVALSYAVYEGITLSLWQAEPVFYTHFYMAQDGLEFLLTNLQLPIYVYALVASGLVIAVVVIYGLLQTMAAAAGSPWLGGKTRAVLLLLTIIAAGMAVTTRATLASPSMTVSSLTAKVERNLVRSYAVYASVHSPIDDQISATHDYSTHRLATTPDIYLIFIESYGSVLYKRDDYRALYTALLDELEQDLEEDGWHSTTALSESPTWGGGSWMAYTSALFGLRIQEHPEYLALLERYQNRSYPDLGNYLKSQGYHYVRASSLAKQLKDSEWQRYKSFFGVDEWLRYDDLGYVGQRYGWGPAPPDQYVLNFARQTAEESTDGAHLLFFITQNSHYPWIPQPTMVDDWRSLNVPEADQEVTPDDELPHSERRQNYFNAIEYQLRFLTDFIRTNEDEDAIFVLVGDHQPPRVSRRDDGWDTPMHIVSKDAGFIDSFADYGFVPGLSVESLDPAMHHEGFYTLFLRQLLANYGVDPTDLPAHLPNGVVKLTAENVKQ